MFFISYRKAMKSFFAFVRFIFFSGGYRTQFGAIENTLLLWGLEPGHDIRSVPRYQTTLGAQDRVAGKLTLYNIRMFSHNNNI